MPNLRSIIKAKPRIALVGVLASFMLLLTACPGETKTFTLGLSSSSLVIMQDNTESVTVTITPVNGFSSPVALSVVGLPSGVTAEFLPNPATTSSTLTLNVSASAAPGNTTLTVKGTSGALEKTATLNLTIEAAPDPPNIDLSLSASSLAIAQGNSGEVVVMITPTGSFAGEVELSVSGLPAGVTSSFSVNPTPNSSVLTLNVAASTAVGNSILTITGTAGDLSDEATLTLSVTETATPDFSLSLSENSLAIEQGDNADITVTVTPTGGFADAVNLSVSGAPAGVTTSFSPNPTPNSGVLSIDVAASAATGNSTLTITGTAGSLSDTVTLTLSVEAPPAVPGFSLSLSSGNIAIEQGASGDVTVTIAPTGGFAEEVSLSVDGVPTGVNSSFSENPARNGSVLTLEVAADATASDSEVTITGTAGSLSNSVTLALSITEIEVPATIGSVEISGYGSSIQVRQGATFDLIITGTGLNNIGLAKLGDVTGSVDSNNDTSAVISFSIPHGAELGLVGLTLDTDAGVLSKADAVEITAITSGPAGDDASGHGTPDSPYKTFDKAYSVSSAGDSISLLDGVYSREIGFPYNISELNIAGQSRAGTVIEGTTSDFCFFATLGDTNISSLTLDTCDYALDITGGKMTLSDVAVKNSVVGLSAKGAAEVVIWSSIFDSNQYGVEATGAAQVTLEGSSASTNSADGIIVSSSATMTLANISATGNVVSGLHLIDSAEVTATDSSFDGNQFGIEVYDDAQVTMEGGSASTNDDYGIFATDNATLTLTDIVASSNITGTGIGLIVANSATVTANDSSFDDNVVCGACVYGAATLTITGGSASSNGEFGIYAEANATLTLTNVATNGNEVVGMRLIESPKVTVAGGSLSSNTDSGIQMTDNAVLTLTNVAVDDNGRNGLVVSGSATVTAIGSSFNRNRFGANVFMNGTLTITGGSASNNDRNGYSIWGGVTIGVRGGNLKLRDVVASGNPRGVAILGNPVSVDLGIPIDPGGNTITGNDYNLFDERSEVGVNITAYGTDFMTTGSPPPSPIIGATASPPNYFISTVGNRIVF